MEKQSSDIRRSFLEFFAQRGHTVVPSAPVVPQDDPTLLFSNAGMNQFKDVFLGTGTRPYRRAVNSQKCIRVSGKHNDLEEVGHDTYHHTFFEMLGNWSFGDYYKEEAILWAWELLTAIWGLPKARLWATVFREDDEAERLWKKVTDIRPSQILRFGEKDNFWEMGATGPCGPCSEIHIDLGEDFCDRRGTGHVCGVNAGCGRYIELWNLVFIQYNRDESEALLPLPAKHVDTGMGFERITAVLQGKRSNYDTDLFTPLLTALGHLTGRRYGEGDPAPFRVIADHTRALTFAITDGAIPSNEGRGYVLRRLLRRAARYGRKLGMHEPFLYRLVPMLVETMGAAYPELETRMDYAAQVIRSEEERFNEVLDRGIELFEAVAAEVLARGEGLIPGEDAFRLYDTYGFPLDLTQLLAREKGLGVDTEGFEAAMSRQRERGRGGHVEGAWIEAWEEITPGIDSRFVGYDQLAIQTEIRKLRREGDTIIVLLAETPFYPEGGGQIGDRGEIRGEGFVLSVEETRRQGDQILHIGHFVEGSSISSPRVEARVLTEARLATARNHTATHLLHQALKKHVGSHVHQAGSLVAPDRLRFDFTHFEALSPALCQRIEDEVNTQIRENHPVTKYTTTFEEAKVQGATALFGEKYGETVRVVRVGDYSMELCGGTHVQATGEIGSFRILSEEGVAAGVRRIEAVTGEAADSLFSAYRDTITSLQALFRCREEEILERARALVESRKALEKALQKTKKESSTSDLDRLLAEVRSIDGVRFVAGEVQAEDVEGLRLLGDRLRERLRSGVGILGMKAEDKVHLLAVVTDDLIHGRGLKAGDLVKAVAAVVGGSGGGRPHLALAGGKEVGRLGEAIARVPDILREALVRGSHSHG